MMQTCNVVHIPWKEVTSDVPFVLQGRVNPKIYAHTIEQLCKIRRQLLILILILFTVGMVVIAPLAIIQFVLVPSLALSLSLSEAIVAVVTLAVIIPLVLKFNRKQKEFLASENAIHYNPIGINLVSERNCLRIEMNSLVGGGAGWGIPGTTAQYIQFVPQLPTTFVPTSVPPSTI